ncbi:protein opa [Rodentibacter pneumotropicus]|uniref:Opacity family porin n=2 Tax=Rodentibacter TaxID=1960084 RepID=A0A1V3K824_9PAST|nr:MULTISPECIES: opacity family porin [Pasteurellaceae]AOF54081.1 Opacity protein-related surface antigen [Pasteurellaceae bacterium NI1060]MCQ9120544.1 opacity family porin [Rodentibacter pneumotropicus]MCQ9123074.1 opacity family porin [Rodentibacter heylii]MCR1836670.1 opacity family porin [Pasteurella caecimuris]MCU0106114.1 opacity family porin [Pasteurella caecimuris]
MKKSLLALAIGTLVVASSASANWYVQGDLGVSKTKFTSYSDLNKTKVEPRISVGYKLGNVRLAVDYTHHGKFSGTAGIDTTAKIQGLGFSAIYDIDLNSTITPYVGARLSANQFKVTNRAVDIFEDKSETKFGYGLVAGAKYQLSGNWYVNGGVEYNRLGSYEDTKVNNYGAKLGVGYEF